MTIVEKAAFLKGLVEGSDLKLGEKEARVFNVLLELVEDMAQTLSECDNDLTELYDQVDELENEVSDIEDDLDILFDDFDEEEDDEDFDEPLYEVECPACDGSFSVDEDTLLNGDVRCPFCGEHIEFEVFDDEEDEDEDED